MNVERQSPALVTCGDAMCLRGIRADDRTADFVASTDAIDSHGDIIDQESWRLEHFRANPIVLYGHDSRELPIGKATAVAVRNGQLEVSIKFASAEANPRAEEVWRLVQEGILRAVSVGFLPTDGKYEVRDNKDVFVWRAPILKEISVVPVPANHEALARMKAAYAASQGKKEASMDPKDLQLKIERQAVELTERDAKIKALETEKAALERQTDVLAKARDEAIARASKAEDGLIELEIDALVGVKITPAEKPDFVELRRTNAALCKRMIDQRPTLNLSAVVTPKEHPSAGADRSVSNGGASAALLADVKKSAGLV